jgi:uncharacterized protein (TIGR02598 family)
MISIQKNPRCIAFSLVEVTFAMAVAAVALISIIGMLPHAMEMSRDSADRTAIGTIMEDAHDRMEGLPLSVGQPSVSPLFYDQQGRYIEDIEKIENSLLERAFFRLELEISEIEGANAPENISDLKAVGMQIYWPLRDDGTAIEADPRVHISYYINALTGPDWGLVEPGFQPKIEF